MTWLDVAGKRERCPQCGATTRTIEERITLGAVMQDHIALEVRNVAGDIVGALESLRDGTAGGFDRRKDARIAVTMDGRSRRNEEDSYQVSVRLAARLSALTGELHNAEHYDGARHGGEGLPIDCVLVVDRPGDDQKDSPTRLQFVQVTRAVSDQDFWKSLDHAGGVRREFSIAELARQLRSSIERKIEKIPNKDDRAKLTLALDASYHPVMLLSDVLSEFRRQYGDRATLAGFDQAWVVGRDAEHVHRLDRSG